MPPKKNTKSIKNKQDNNEITGNSKKVNPKDISKEFALNLKDKFNKNFSNKEYGTELDEDGNTDTDYNDELEDEYNDTDQEVNEDEVEKEEDNLDDNVDDEYHSDDEGEGETEEADEDTGENNEGFEETVGEDEGCLYNFNKKKSKDYDSDEDYDEEIFDDEETESDQVSRFILGNDRLTGNVMTKYERVRILAERSKQLMLGAKPMLKDTDNIHPKDIARLELEMGAIPYKIHRERPDGKIEEWKVSELKIVN